MFTKRMTAALLAVSATVLILTSCDNVDTNNNQSSDNTSRSTQSISEKNADTPNTSDLDEIKDILTEKQTDFGIVAMKDCNSYLDITVPDYDSVLCIKSYLEVKNLNENLADVHTPKTDPDESLPVSDTKISDPAKIQELVYDLSISGYDFGYSSSSAIADKVKIYVCYEHNVDDLKDLLTDCNVDLSAVEISVGGGIRVNGTVETLCTYLNDYKDDYNITAVKYISPPSASGVEALCIDLSDDSKLDELIAYIKNYSNVSTMQVPISVTGSEYNYYK